MSPYWCWDSFIFFVSTNRSTDYMCTYLEHRPCEGPTKRLRSSDFQNGRTTPEGVTTCRDIFCSTRNIWSEKLITKVRSFQWVHETSSARPKKARRVRSNVTLTVFIDAKRVVHHIEVLKRPRDAIRRKTPVMWRSGDNATAYSAKRSITVLPFSLFAWPCSLWHFLVPQTQ